MDHAEFERSVQEALESLPAEFSRQMENVHVVVEDLPNEGTLKKLGGKSRATLLGLYEGVPKSRRGTWYGAYPVVPDRITLFKTNIERSAGSERTIPEKIREVLIHEIAHHFGMSEKEIRAAGY